MSTQLQTNRFLNEVESRLFLNKYGLEQNQSFLAKSREETVHMAKRLGFPIVLKVVSDQIIHKSDFGGVKVGLHNIADVHQAYEDIYQNAEKRGVQAAEIEGVAVQEMVQGVAELFIGVKRDPVFGTILVVGLGGVWVEVIKDVSLGVSPLAEEDIHKMITSLKGFPLINGYRGRKKGDLAALIKFIKKVEKMAISEENIVELDVNPVVIKEEGQGCLAVDARILLAKDKKII